MNSNTVNTVTPQGIEGKIIGEDYLTTELNPVLTICVLKLENGFTVTGESAPVDPNNFNLEIGKTIARANALDKIWTLEGYLLKQALHQSV